MSDRSPDGGEWSRTDSRGHDSESKTRTLRQKVDVEAFQILQILGHQNASSAEGGRRRDEPGKENVELKNCIALVVI